MGCARMVCSPAIDSRSRSTSNTSIFGTTTAEQQSTGLSWVGRILCNGTATIRFLSTRSSYKPGPTRCGGSMFRTSKWYLDHRLWLEVFVLCNFAFLSVDIYLAHSVNQFRRPAEYIPLYFSLAAPVVLLTGLLSQWLGFPAVWKDLGYLVGWVAAGVGLAGVLLHLDSSF